MREIYYIMESNNCNNGNGLPAASLQSFMSTYNRIHQGKQGGRSQTLIFNSPILCLFQVKNEMFHIFDKMNKSEDLLGVSKVKKKFTG